jgi:drug/metabolite transporter (DMT)-like permease
MTPAVSMDSFTFAAVLAAAAMHAGWNAVLKVRLEPFLAMTLITGAAGIVGVPLLAVFGWPKAEAWPWLIGSVALHLAYYVALTEAYRSADMGQIYPIARGGAPLLTASASLLILQEPISLQGALGIAFLGSGVALMSLRGTRKHEPLDRAAIGFALAIAVIICGYTLVDGIGARVAGDPHAYSAALFVIDGVTRPAKEPTMSAVAVLDCTRLVTASPLAKAETTLWDESSDPRARTMPVRTMRTPQTSSATLPIS